MTEITLVQAETATDVETLIEYCKQGAIENEQINGEALSAWRDGWHLIESYLDHNKSASKETLEQVAAALTAWLKQS